MLFFKVLFLTVSQQAEMLAAKQQKTQFICVEFWILILVLKFFIIFFCLVGFAKTCFFIIP